MVAEHDRSFDRKLEQLVVARLRGGQAPEILLEDLKRRLTPTEAEDLLSRAEARIRGAQVSRMPIAGHILIGLVYVWVLILILQNVGILFALNDIPTLPGDPGPATWIAMTFFKVGLLGVAVFAFNRWRGATSAAGLALAIVYAFPLGRFVEGWLGFGFGPQDPAILVSGSAAPSYVAVVLIAAVYRLARREARSPPAVEAFD